MTKITEVLKLIYDIQEPRRDTLEGMYQPRFLHSNTTVPKGLSNLILTGQPFTLTPLEHDCPYSPHMSEKR